MAGKESPATFIPDGPSADFECQDSRQAIPIQVRICTYSQLRRHVFDHLWGDLAPESLKSKPLESQRILRFWYE